MAIDLRQNCIGHWKLNDNTTSTTVADSSGSGNHGTSNANTSVFGSTDALAR